MVCFLPIHLTFFTLSPTNSCRSPILFCSAIKSTLSLCQQKKKKIMNTQNTATATISISNVITVTDGAKVNTLNMGSFEQVIKGYDSIIIEGLAKPKKLEKYSNILRANNFELSQTMWCDNAGFDNKNSDVLNYRLEFSSKN